MLLLGVPAHHLVLVLIHFFLALEESSLLVLRQDHICLRLLLLLLDDASLLIVFLDHALHDSIDLGFLFKVLLMSLLTKNGSIIDLLLDVALVIEQLIEFLHPGVSLELIADFFVLKHGHIHLSVLLLHRSKHSKVSDHSR